MAVSSAERTETYVETLYHWEYSVSVEHNKGEAGPIMDIDNIFFSLLKLGTGLSDSVSLPTMNRDLWRSVFRMAEKHAMPGIMVDAVNALPDDVNKPDRDLLMKLISLGIEIEKRKLTLEERKSGQVQPQIGAQQNNFYLGGTLDNRPHLSLEEIKRKQEEILDGFLPAGKKDENGDS